MLFKYLRFYLQQSLVYDSFFTESLDNKIDCIDKTREKLNKIKSDSYFIEKIRSDSLINNIGDQKIFNLLNDFQKINQESSIIPIIIN